MAALLVTLALFTKVQAGRGALGVSPFLKSESLERRERCQVAPVQLGDVERRKGLLCF